MRLRRPAILDHEEERILRIVDDLLVIEQLEEAIVGNVLFAAVTGAAAEEESPARSGRKRSRKG